MPDISMCNSKECELRKTCYRHEAKPDRWQAYFVIDNNFKTGKDCEHYWKLEGGK